MSALTIPEVRQRARRRNLSPLERIQARLWRTAEIRSHRGSACGIELRAMSVPQGMEELFYARVRVALVLIEKYEPRRLVRIRRDISAIGGVAGGADGWYQVAARSILLSWPAVLRSTSAELAMTIVHEATHARIESLGVRYEEPLRTRIESLCVAQEAAFARTLPGGELLADRALEKLSRPWWSPEDLLLWRMEFGRAHNVPQWLLKFAVMVGRRRLRRASRRRAREADPSLTNDSATQEQESPQ
jgi:hypothetical protein